MNQTRLVAFALFAIALGILSVARLGAPESELTHDGAHYLEIARHLAEGEGYTTQTHWALNLDRPYDDDAPQFPDAYRAPMFPLLVAGAYAVTGDLFGSARWIVLLLGACIPPLVFLIARRELKLPVAYAALAGLIAAVHHHLVISSTRPLTETPYALGVLATVYLVLSGRVRTGGLVAGITWLFRTQGFLLVPISLVALAFRRRHGGFTRNAAWFVGMFALAIAPWVVRTLMVTGQPFYTDLKYHVLSTYDPDIVDFDYELTTFEYFRGLTPAPEPIGYLLAHPGEVVAHVSNGLSRLARTGARENAGNVYLAFLAVIGLAALLRGRPIPLDTDRPRRFLFVVLTLAVLNVAVVSIAFIDSRHLTSLDPFLALASALGVWVIATWIGRRWGRADAVVALGIAAVGLVGESVSTARHMRAFVPRAFPEAAFAASVIDPDTPGAVMAQKPYFYSYLLDRPAVSLPWCTDEEFCELVEAHRVRYVVIPDDVRDNHAYPGSFLERGESVPWLRAIGRHERPGPATIYEVVDSASTQAATPVTAAR